MEEKLKRKEDESFEQYEKRLVDGKFKDGTLSEFDHTEIYKAIFDVELNSSEARKRMYGLRDHFAKNEAKKIDEIKLNSDDTYLKELEEKKLEIEKEKIKLRTEKIEYNKLIREQSRNELWWENLDGAVGKLAPFSIPMYINKTSNNRDGLLIIADNHYGRECKIKGLYGETISEYNTEIFKERMWNLLNQVVECCNERGLNHLNIFNLGDFIDGLLRISQLNSLQLGVVDSVLEYSEFMATWLNELSTYVTIDYFQTQGNHDEIRILTGKKNDFPHENVSKLIIKFIELRLVENPNIKIHESKTDFVYIDICGVNVLGYHGEDKNLINSIRYFRSLYKQPIDLLFGGHLHSQSLDTEGIGSYGDAQCIRVSGICGIDDYSTKLQKSARAGASMFIFKEGKGKTSQEDFWLN